MILRIRLHLLLLFPFAFSESVTVILRIHLLLPHPVNGVLQCAFGPMACFMLGFDMSIGGHDVIPETYGYAAFAFVLG